jgi:single-stranded-DNA-specific exonuclease
MTQQWRLLPHDPALVAAFSRESGQHPLVAQLLLNRGVRSAGQVQRFLEAKRASLHEPDGLPGVAEAADRIAAAIRAGRKIVVYGDYDVDGVCGTSVLWSCLKLAGATGAEYYIPNRIDEGYGVNAEALRKLAAERKAEMVITVDCGITARAEAELARELGIELIITDHHTPGAELPRADALVHPRLPGGSYPFGELCGCGVAFKLAWQICKGFGDGKKASPHLRDFLMRSINLVALATVADVVPLEDENRVFVRHGLRGLAVEPSVGLRALMQVAGCLGKQRLSTGTLGFSLAPRINAAGRLACAMKAVEMLTTDDAERARELAEELDRCNRERQDIERRTLDEARAIIEASGGAGERGALVVGKEGWHPGVIGIVAGRLAEAYHRPSIVLALGGGVGQGSARSVPGFNLVEALRACSDALLTFGGHAAAAGLKLDAGAWPAFARRFDEHCRAHLTDEQRRKELVLDAEVLLGELTPAVVDQIERLEPYGIGNPKPLLLAERVRIVGDPRAVGERQNHLQLRFAQGSTTLRAIGWNLANRSGELTPGASCSVAFTPTINEWNGRREVQVEIKDVQVHRGEPRPPAGRRPAVGEVVPPVATA